MSEAIPDHIDLMRAARSGEHLNGSLKPAKMRRLLELLANANGQIDVRLDLTVNERRQAQMTGSLHAKVEAFCQRCMEPIETEFDVQVDLALVETEDQQLRLPEHLDSLVIEQTPSSLTEIIEDELILAFPAVTMHEVDACKASRFLKDKRQIEDSDNSERKNPFAALKDFKQ